MLTPQDIQKVSFDRSLFGGYDMQQVDEFLQPLSEDYIALYQENAVLKSKLKVLVESLREYQVRESTIDASRARAQREADLLREKTRAECSRMLEEAEAKAREQLSELLSELRAEQARVNTARRAAGDFVALLEQTVAQQLTTLRLLKSMSTQELDPQRQAYDYDNDDPPLPEPPAPLSAADAARVSRAASRLLDEVDQQTRPATDAGYQKQNGTN